MFVARHRDRVASRAVIPVRLRVAGQRVTALAVGGQVAVRRGRRRERRVVGRMRRVDVAGVAGDDVDRARSRRSERGPERVVAEREVLRVVPHRRDRVAVVVVHVGVRLAGGSGRAVPVARADALDEVVHLAAVERLLLVGVVVVLVAGQLALPGTRSGRRSASRRLRRVLVGVVGEQIGGVAQAAAATSLRSPAAGRPRPACPARRGTYCRRCLRRSDTCRSSDRRRRSPGRSRSRA